MGFKSVLGAIVILLICHQQLFFTFAAVIKKRKIGNLINDGKEAATNQFPWQVMVQSNLSSGGGERFCGGTIISSKWILTAGHCINGANNVTLSLGSNDWSTSEIRLSSNQFIIHPEFKYRSAYHNDIGLIAVENVTFSENIQAIHLPAKDQMGVSFVGVKSRFQGWGLSSENGTQPGTNLKWMDTIVIKNSECASDYGSIVTESVICSRGGGICGSDFGGPLSVKEKEGWVLIGIASFTQGCDYEKPIGFTRVTSHLSWISEQTGIEIVY